MLWVRPALSRASAVAVCVAGVVGLLGACATLWPAAAGADEAATVIEGPFPLTTPDGWTLQLWRLRPPGPTTGLPVLFVHGTAVDHRCFRVDGADAMAMFASAGRDTWAVDLRTTRSALPPRGGGKRERTLDALADHDVPAAIDEVLHRTGAPALDAVAHSLGAIVTYEVAQGPQGTKVAGLCAVGGPGRYDHPHAVARLAGRLAPLVQGAGQLPGRAAAQGLAPAVRAGRPPRWSHLIFAHEAVDGRALAPFVRSGMQDVDRALSRQYLQWVGEGAVRRADGRDVLRSLADVRVPALFIAGRDDHIVPPWTVLAAFDAWGAAKKDFLVVGRAWGAPHDAGHGDEVVGSAVGFWVPKCLSFLRDEHGATSEGGNSGNRSDGAGSEPVTPRSTDHAPPDRPRPPPHRLLHPEL